jgi:hypothetical protein
MREPTVPLVEWLEQSAVLWEDAAEQIELLAPAMPDENDQLYLLARAAWYRRHADECRNVLHHTSGATPSAA